MIRHVAPQQAQPDKSQGTPRAERAAVEADSLAHPDQPVTAAIVGELAEDRIRDLNLDGTVLGGHLDLSGHGTGVLQRVGERFLHDPVCDQVWPR